MQIDMTTQEIWHFIGSFYQITEAARGRASYDAYKAEKAQQVQNDLEFQNTPFKAPYKLGDFQPGLWIDTPEQVSPTTSTKVAVAYQRIQTQDTPQQAPAPVHSPELILSSARGFGPNGFVIELPPPASVAVIFAQSNTLSDQDIYIQQDFGISFVPFSTFDAPMAALIAKAEDLDQLGVYDHPSDVAAIKAVGWQIAEDISTLTMGNHGTLIEGSDTYGIYVNGAAADAVPVLANYLPDVPKPVSMPSGSSLEDQLTAAANTGPAHIAITGGNSLMNEVELTVSWLDAPVMLVQGDYLSVNVISQINVLSEHLNSTYGAAAQSQMINAALHGITPGPPPEVPADGLGVFPTSWIITTLQADLVVCNWMTQQNFVIDHDVLSVTWSGAASFLRLGDNSLINIADLLQLGQGYDLIVIGGDMVNVSMIRQMNVLLDADWVATEGGQATISAGGNLLWNGAQITGTGQDSMLAMDQSYGEMANAVMTGSTGSIPMAITDAAFEGIATLKVLYITGDHMTLNMIDQTNVLGDADQVAALATKAIREGGAEISVIAGANALINLATINTEGVDSFIHVGGDIYSDAMIYQANFIDDDAADPYAAQGPAALASEAVLFLADGMLSDGDAPSAYVSDAALNSGQLDGVNAVLV